MAGTPPTAQGAGEPQSRPDAIDRGIATYLRHLAVERGLSANTLQAYGRDIARYRSYLSEQGIHEPQAVTEAVLGGYTQWLSTHFDVSATSVTRMLSSVRGLHRFWFLEEITDTNPGARIRSPKKPRRLPKALTVEQVEALLAAVSGDDPVSLRDRALLEFMYATGSRVSEAVGVTVDEVYDTELVRLHGKGSKDRLVPMGSYARAAIDTYLVRVRPHWASFGRGAGRLFLGPRGYPLSRQSAWLVIKAAAERADLGVPVSPHTLRHSFATHLLQGGADVRVVQELLGHASVATTQIYTKVTIDSLREVYATTHPRAVK